MDYDIEWINDATPNIDYSNRALNTDYDQEHYTELFERRLAKRVQGAVGDCIGGLNVYTVKDKIVAVYDYENYCGWWAK